MINDKQVLELLKALIGKTQNGSIVWQRASNSPPERNYRHYEAQLKAGRLFFEFFSPDTERDHVKVTILNGNNYFVANLTIWDNDEGWAVAKPLLDAIENVLGQPEQTLDAMMRELRGLAATAS